MAMRLPQRFQSRFIVILILTLSFLVPSMLFAQDRLYWDFPEVLKAADGGQFPQILNVGDRLALVWQEFQGEPGSLDATISIKALFTDDVFSWDSQTVVIAEGIPYLWLEQIPLFTATVGMDNRLLIAVPEARTGVAIYRQTSPNSIEVFERTDLIASGNEAADVAVAPRIVSTPDGGYMLFLTRRAQISGGFRDTTLTIYTSSSSDGRDWSSPTLFLNPEIDRSAPNPDGAQSILEQNFLPYYLADGENEYVVFQTLREGISQAYQLYIKTRFSGESWSSASPLTELLEPSEGINDPLIWDNQRAFLKKTPENEILLAWERRSAGKLPDIAVAVLNPDGSLASTVVENVIQGRSSSTVSAFPSITSIDGNTWLIWLDDTGIRLARREGAYAYSLESVSLDSNAPLADQNSTRYPKSIIFQGESYVYWQDRASGLERIVFLRPDLKVDTPTIISTNFPSAHAGSQTNLELLWRVPVDPSGILSYKWLWSTRAEDSASNGVEEIVTTRENRAQSIRYRLEDPRENEGTWYFSLIVQDQVGNWSAPLKLVYNLDLTAPPPPVVTLPPTGANGYLNSNTFTIEWRDGEAELAQAYRWRLDYLSSSPENLDLQSIQATTIGDPKNAFALDEGLATPNRSINWNNLDDGVWAFSVAAIDNAGNQGKPNTQIFFLNRYVPITYITDVSFQKDLHDRIDLRIVGRGFSVGSTLDMVIIDQDGEEPWDYQFNSANSSLSIISYDRIVEITGIEAMNAGNYYIGVHHPLRGTVFWNRTMQLSSTGTVKFGPLGLYAYESLWKSAAQSLRITGNQLLYFLLILLGLAAFIFTVIRLVILNREARKLEYDVRAILTNQPLSANARAEAIKTLRRKGMGLRRKFTIALTVLVVITITMIASVLGFVWIQMERSTLAEGLENESRLMVETLASSARNSIPAADRGELLLLPDRISALPDALWTIVTGPRSTLVNGELRSTGDGYDYVWSSNNPNLLNLIALPERLEATSAELAREAGQPDELIVFDKAYTAGGGGAFTLTPLEDPSSREVLVALLRRVNLMPNNAGYGEFMLDDELSDLLETMRQEVEQAAQDAGITGMISELVSREERYKSLSTEVAFSLDFDNPEFIAAGEEVDAQKKEIETLLLELSSGKFGSYPEFSSSALLPDSPETYVFYKPLLYRTGLQDSNFFKGSIRLAVSVADIRSSLAIVQRRILTITALVAIASLLIGVMVALFISRLMIRPILRLKQDVENVSGKIGVLADTKDPFDFVLNTGDEIQDLSESVHGFIIKLIEAEKDQKDLIAGQAIQKTFLPLDTVKDDKNADIKLSTGGDSNAFFRLFGYYEGADAVSGDYFDFRKLNEEYYVMIKLDISGHGVEASLLMVQVAALYVDYFRRVRVRYEEKGSLEYNLRDFTFRVNDLLNEVGFKGKFAAFNLSVINVRSSEYEMIHAGDNLVHIFDSQTRKMKTLELPEAPAAGPVDSALFRDNQTMYQPVKGSLKKGDVLFLYTDGIDEAHHLLRDEEFKIVAYKDLPREIIAADQEFIQATYEYKSHERLNEKIAPQSADELVDAALDDEEIRVKDSRYKQIRAFEEYEEFDAVRVREVIEAAMNRTNYTLTRRCDLTVAKPLHFDFTTLRGIGEDAIMALASVEKVFRIVPDSSDATKESVKVDRKIDAFLQKHFREYGEFYTHKVDEDVGYVYFSHLKEDKQDDDLTLWAYERL